MLKGLLLSLSLITLSVCVMAQSGTIKGNVKDAVSGDAIIGASVLVMGTSQGAQADIEGNFEIPKIKAGTYSLVVSFVSYKTDTVASVTVYPDQTTIVNTTIVEEGQELNEVVITGTRVTNTDLSVVTEIRKSDLVAVGISAQQISMSQDRDAAQIMKRIPGVTIMNNRFINVRGLSERYSTVMLNGIIAPSTEVDSKAFAFDLIPSNMLDRMLVYKSGSPELPGEFAGADVSIYTKSIVDENSFSVSLSGSFRANTTGENVRLGQYKDKTDWLGGNGGNRNLPSAFPSKHLTQASTEEVVAATRLLPNTWNTRALTASPDYRVNVDFGRTMNIGSMKLDNLTSISYAHTNQLIELQNNDFTNPTTANFHYNDVRFTQTNRLGAVSNFTFSLSPSHRIEFRNFYNQQGQNQSTLRTGIDDAAPFDVQNQSTSYFSRSIYSGQLSGKHNFSDALMFNWIFGFSQTNATQPDYQSVRSQRTLGSTDPFQIVLPPTASSTDASRFFSKLNEKNYSAAGNFEYKLNPGAETERQTKIIAGYYLEQKNRDFAARWMAYKQASVNSVTLEDLHAPFYELFRTENMGTKLILDEGTNVGNGSGDSQNPGNFDRYDGINKLIAGYAGIVSPLGQKFRLSAGMRVENNTQQIEVYEITGKKLRLTDNTVLVPMPFGNLSYNFTDKMLLRVAYSRTVNRPVFRELAPFNYYDFDRNVNIIGNPTLKTAKIHNVDLRWELYPTDGESISVGVFYKHFQDPIEQVIQQGSNPFYGYRNATKATNYGVEAELRKSLQGLSSDFLRRLTVVFNGALIFSEIQFDPNDPLTQNLEQKRALQGQSPYVTNTSLYYNAVESGLQVSLQHNIFGKRIFAVGDMDRPNRYEMPRHQFDLTVSKRLSEKLEMKVGVQDIFNQRYRLVEDSNRDKKITKEDNVIQTYRWGQYGTLGIVWKL